MTRRSGECSVSLGGKLTLRQIRRHSPEVWLETADDLQQPMHQSTPPITCPGRVAGSRLNRPRGSAATGPPDPARPTSPRGRRACRARDSSPRPCGISCRDQQRRRIPITGLPGREVERRGQIAATRNLAAAWRCQSPTGSAGERSNGPPQLVARPGSLGKCRRADRRGPHAAVVRHDPADDGGADGRGAGLRRLPARPDRAGVGGRSDAAGGVVALQRRDRRGAAVAVLRGGGDADHRSSARREPDSRHPGLDPGPVGSRAATACGTDHTRKPPSVTGGLDDGGRGTWQSVVSAASCSMSCHMASTASVITAVVITACSPVSNQCHAAPRTACRGAAAGTRRSRSAGTTRLASALSLLRRTHDHHRDLRAMAATPRATSLSRINREHPVVIRHGLRSRVERKATFDRADGAEETRVGPRICRGAQIWAADGLGGR
jgi:hypothetical protein